MTSKQLQFWLAATYVPGIGPRTIMRWLELFSDIKLLFQASADELEQAGVPPKHWHSIQHPDWRAIENDIAWAQSASQHLICFDDPDYPHLLKEIHDPPLVLYVRGDKEALTNTQIAIVGSRHATHAGNKNAENFARQLAASGFAVTSGLALGIDGSAHRGALAASGVTIGVAGTGLNHIYPSSHRQLVEDIIYSNGAVISEFPLHTTPVPMNFPRRNRIIGGLSIGVLVVEAARKSGSLITARLALEQGREVFAIPGSIHNPLARGCHHLIRQGAKLVETIDDILEEYNVIATDKTAGANPSKFPENLAPEQCLIIDQIGHEITPLDVIILRSGLTAGEVSSILLALELHGHVQSVPGGYVRIIGNQ